MDKVSVITKMEWYGDNFARIVHDGIRRNVSLALATLAAQIWRNLGVSGGGIPSNPGEFPKEQSGNLRNSIFWQQSDAYNLFEEVGGFVGVKLPEGEPYPYFLEVGVTGGKTIYPKSKNVLSWVDPRTGERRFAMSVTQGAIRDRSYMQRTFDEMKPFLATILGRNIETFNITDLISV